MSLMAGVVRRHPNVAAPDEIARQLRRAVSRLHDSRVEVLSSNDYFLFKCDFGSFGAPGVYRTANGTLTLLCGEPLLRGGEGRNRYDDLQSLHREFATGNTSVLKEARGTFAVAHFDAATKTLTLATDRVGIRPLYVWLGDEYVVFASALRILESIAEIPKEIDLQGITEKAAFGFPLGDRTPYTTCKLLRSGEVLVAAPEGVQRWLYTRWDEVPLSREGEADRAEIVYRAFSGAVKRRAAEQTVNLSFLTGGLDSRCIASELRRQGSTVHSYCFGLDGSQDVVFSAQFARAIGSIHRRVPIPPAGSAPYPTPDVLPLDTPRTKMIWSGDGGSVGLGHVYLTPAMIQHMRAGNLDAAIVEFREHNHVRVPTRVLARAMRKHDDLLHAAISAELSDLRCEDPGRALFLLLLHNDQRRHLGKHFEDIDLHQWELQLPFFDSEFLAAVIGTPIDWCLGHRLYGRVLRCFPPVTTAVPWQAYPGHEPCPLPIPPELGYQWVGQEASPRHQAVRRALLANTRRMLRAPEFPASLLDRKSVRAAYWLTRLGLRDYQYVLGTAEVYDTHWRAAHYGALTADITHGTRPEVSPSAA